MSDYKTVCIIGAGLVGCLSAIAFHNKGYKVTLVEYRKDLRLDTTSNGNLRSINLAISSRGFKAIEHIDPQLLDKVMDKVIPMHGRMIHDLEGNEQSQLYGLYGESINSIDRRYLNQLLLDEIDDINSKSLASPIQLWFEKKLISLKFDERIDETPVVEVIDQVTGEQIKQRFDLVIGSDGAFSATRYQIQKKLRMNFTQEYIDTCYVELYIPPGPNNSFLLDPNHLHIWPRKDFMLIALANQDGSFTSTFFGPWGLAESLNTKEIIESFFQQHFRDAAKLIGEDRLVDAFLNNPKGVLLQVHCNPYNYKGKAVLLGDAAHAMVPFYGQGMNCGFESLRVLLEELENHNDNSDLAFDSYSAKRHEDLEAILKLALDNYLEMSTKVTSGMYLVRKKIDGVLSRLLKDRWLPLYTMVSFRADIPYSKAIKTEESQQKIIKKLQYLLLITAVMGSVKIYKLSERFLRSLR